VLGKLAARALLHADYRMPAVVVYIPVGQVELLVR
jgi:hypothetical protein